MANQNINPTRMELIRLKSRLKTTMRGHKLLKDRVDEMVRQFVKLINENKILRQSIEAETISTLRAFSMSQTKMTRQETETAIALPYYCVEINTSYSSIMGLSIPKLELKKRKNPFLELKQRNYSINSLIMPYDEPNEGGLDALPYSFSSTVSEFDSSIARIYDLIERLLTLAEVDKACDILAEEIQKTRRRVNALEQFVIPQIKAEMKRIMMKLDENERSNLVRLMKVKEQIIED